MDVPVGVSKRKIIAMLLLCAGLWRSPSLHAQWTGAERDNAENLTVMIDVYYKGLPSGSLLGRSAEGQVGPSKSIE